MFFESYVFSMCLGGVVLLVSLLGGGGDDSDGGFDKDFDKDFDFDSDLDADLDVDVEADMNVDLDIDPDMELDVDKDIQGFASAGEDLLWIPFLSMRFWTFGLTSYGLSGLLFTLFETSVMLSFGVSLGLGLVMGWLIANMFHKLKKSNVSGATDLKNQSGQEAKVILRIGPDKMGKIRLLSGGQFIDLPAVSNQDIQIGDEVLVLKVDKGVAKVVSLTERKKREAEAKIAKSAQQAQNSQSQ